MLSSIKDMPECMQWFLAVLALFMGILGTLHIIGIFYPKKDKQENK